MDHKIRTEKVIRIVQSGWQMTLFWSTPVYIKAVVGFRYYVDDQGPFDINMQPYREPRADTKEMIRAWKKCGRRYTRGAKPQFAVMAA